MLHSMLVVSICFECFMCFIRMLQVFYLDVAKVDVNVACVCYGFQVFLDVFASVSDICCKCFIWMLQK
jgi:hypothetical protein